MTKDVRQEFEALSKLVEVSAVPDEVKRTLLWCLQQLPELYDQLGQTYDIRFSDKIIHLEQGILGELGKAAKGQSAGHQLVEEISEQLRFIHEQNGLPPLVSKSARTRKSA
jgi:hypothetical protein